MSDRTKKLLLAVANYTKEETPLYLAEELYKVGIMAEVNNGQVQFKEES